MILHFQEYTEYPFSSDIFVLVAFFRYGQCVTYGSFTTRRGEFLYFLLGMVFLYILPLVVITFTYGGIILHLHKKKVVSVVGGGLFRRGGGGGGDLNRGQNSNSAASVRHRLGRRRTVLALRAAAVAGRGGGGEMGTERVKSSLSL